MFSITSRVSIYKHAYNIFPYNMLASGASTTQDVEPTEGIKYVKGVITDEDGIRTTAALTVQVSKPSEKPFNFHASTACRPLNTQKTRAR